VVDEIKFHLGVKAIIRDEIGRILLLKVRTDELAGYSGPAYWDIPGGRIQWESVIRDKDTNQIQWPETVMKTLEREVQEETGLTGIVAVRPFSFIISDVSYPVESGEMVGLLLRSYICDIPEVGTITLSQEHIDFEWFEPGEAAELLKKKFPGEFCEAIGDL
jgi:8-oxo-dGTP pyrophosphatase MutT (NUDIX family)